MKEFYIKLRNFFDMSIYNNKILLILSLLVSIVIWAFVTQKEYPDSTDTIKNIPIDFEASLYDSAAGKDGYKIYMPGAKSVDINVTANRTKLAFLNNQDFYAKISVDDYKSDQQPVMATVQVFRTETNAVDCTWNIIGSQKIEVYFYKEITRTIDIKDENINAPNITAAEGFKLTNKTCDSLSITGPEPYINSIDGCMLTLTQSVSYDTRKSIPVEVSLNNLSFYDVEGNELNDTLRPFFSENEIKLNKKDLTVTMYISMISELGISYNIDGVPSYFDEKFIRDRLTLTPATIKVSSDDPSLEDMVSLPVSTDQNIKLSDIGLDFTTVFDINQALISYPSLTNDSNISEAYVTFDSTGLDKKTFKTLSDFKFKNPYSSKYDVEKITQQLTDVTVIGPKSEIDRLTADDLSLEIDISKNSMASNGKPTTGRNFYTVSVIPDSKFKNVWVYGDYTAELEIKEISDISQASAAAETE
ncbi:MAG: hypothetical protein Q4F95_08415 [Oscillospiraceae bacterium]|nr:hypothetical protein [Oscillospiraceae bacterium]